MSCNTRGRDRAFLVGLLDEQFLVDQALENAGRSLRLLIRLDVRDPGQRAIDLVHRDFLGIHLGGNLSGGLRAAIITSARSEQKCCRDCCQAELKSDFGMIDLMCIIGMSTADICPHKVATLAMNCYEKSIETQLTLLCSILVPL